MEKKSNHFSGQIGFVLAAAGSAVGVGNLWRFPYLAAKDGGGLFLLVYLALVLTFGFTLLTSDIAIGRRTQKSAIGAYAEMHPKWKFLGILTFLVPVLAYDLIPEGFYVRPVVRCPADPLERPETRFIFAVVNLYAERFSDTESVRIQPFRFKHTRYVLKAVPVYPADD